VCDIAGTVCTPKLTDGGIATCGGTCCSRSCQVNFLTGTYVCQPPSGCRPTGELCYSDKDCCGYGLPTSPGSGTTTCSKGDAGSPVGRCDNGTGCRPAGRICAPANTIADDCSKEKDCCSAFPGSTETKPLTCQFDLLGIPRCTLENKACPPDAGSLVGQPCASSADCCGYTCVPNASAQDGGVQYVCNGVCVQQGSACTTTADCCPGLPCVIEPGKTTGTCGGSSDGGTSGDGGTTSDGGATSDSGSTSDGGDSGTCSAYGQLCGSGYPGCCAPNVCIDGRCLQP
jgi:hypothetical protein